MSDIFRIPSRAMTLEHLQTFLGLDDVLNLEMRPKEGLRLDYKRELNADLPKLVAAFANTFGGAAIIGVEEVNGIPTSICGYGRSRTDLQTTIRSKIESSLRPPFPQYEVIVLRLNESRDVAIVRVAQGDGPPCQHQNGAFYLRSGDRLVTASLDEILRLAEQAGSKQPDLATDGMPETVWVRRRNYDTAFESESSPTFLTLCVRPRRPSGMRLDAAAEETIERLIRTHFNQPFVVSDRRGSLIEWQHFPQETDADRHIAVVEDGRVCYAGQVVQEGKTCVLSLIDVSARFCALAFELLQEQGQHGTIEFALHLSTGESEIIGMRDNACRELMGIRHFEQKSTRPHPIVVQATVDELAPGAELIADCVFRQLRSDRAASIAFSVFESAVQQHIAERLRRQHG